MENGQATLDRTAPLFPNAFRFGHTREKPLNFIVLEFATSPDEDSVTEKEPQVLGSFAIPPDMFRALFGEMFSLAVHLKKEYSVDLWPFNNDEGGAGDEQS
jgi:hypothetical protein